MAVPNPNVFDALVDVGAPDPVDARLLAELVERMLRCPPGDNPLAALIDDVRRAGFDAEVRSWTEQAQPLRLPPDGVLRMTNNGKLVDDAWLKQVAQRVRMDTLQISRRYAALVPYVVKTLTPRGEVPSRRVVEIGLESLGQRAAR
jgi:uncharacterized protein YidB (DUF937 family)